MIYASTLVKDISIDYTGCAELAGDNTFTNVPPGKVSSTFKSATKQPPQWNHTWENYQFPSGKILNTSVCTLRFDIPEPLNPPVLFYYRLTNFYQNHRRYVKSIDTEQLKGKARTKQQISSGDCSPLAVAPAPDGRPYYPCGLIANSMFNDTFGNLTLVNELTNPDGSKTDSYNMTKQGTSWSNEGALYGESAYKPSDVVPPPFWADQYPDDGYNSTQLPNLHTWDEFQVWMRTAGLPTFSKLYQRNDHDKLESGTYQLKIYDRMAFVVLILCRVC